MFALNFVLFFPDVARRDTDLENLSSMLHLPYLDNFVFYSVIRPYDTIP